MSKIRFPAPFIAALAAAAVFWPILSAGFVLARAWMCPLPQQAETTAMFSAAHGQQRKDVACSQTMPYDLRVISAVAQHAVDAGGDPVDPLADRDADGGGEALAQRAGGDADPGRIGRRMALEGRVDAPQRVQVLADGARFLQGGPEDGRAVALGEDELVDVARGGVLRIEAELVEVEHRHDFGARHAGGRVTAAGLGGRGEGVAAELLGHFFERSAVGHGFS